MERLQQLLTPASWPGWIILLWKAFDLLYRATDAWSNAEFVGSKMELITGFVNSPLAGVLAFAWLFLLVVGWPQKLWHKIRNARVNVAPALDSRVNAGDLATAMLSRLALQEQQIRVLAYVVRHEIHWALEAVNSHFVVTYLIVNASMFDFALGASIIGKIRLNDVELKDPVGFRDAEVQPIHAGGSDTVALRQYLNQEEMQALALPGTDLVIDLSWVKIRVQTARPDKTNGPTFDLPIHNRLEAKAPSWLISSQAAQAPGMASPQP